jgi:membrane associated rhomboid family serine protease
MSAPIWPPKPTTTAILTINIVIFLTQVIFKQDWTAAMSNQVYKTAYFSQVYRWITHSFQHLGILHLLSNMAFLWLIGMPVESFIGSIPMLGLSLLFAIIEGILYTYTYFFIYLVTSDQSWLQIAVAGYSDTLFCLIWIFIVGYNIQSFSFFGVISIPSRVYPFILLLLSSFGNGSVSFVAHAVGLVTGICYHFGFLNYCSFPRVSLLWFEKKTKIGIFLSKFIPNFVPTPDLMNAHIELEQFEWTTKRYRYGIDLDRLSLGVFFRDFWNFIASGCCFCSKTKFGTQLENAAFDGPISPPSDAAKRARQQARLRAGQQFLGQNGGVSSVNNNNNQNNQIDQIDQNNNNNQNNQNENENLFTPNNFSNQKNPSQKNQNLGLNQPLHDDIDDVELGLDFDGVSGQLYQYEAKLAAQEARLANQGNVDKNRKKIKTKSGYNKFDNVEGDQNDQNGQNDDDQSDLHQSTDKLLYPDSYNPRSIQGDNGKNASVHMHDLPTTPNGRNYQK